MNESIATLTSNARDKNATGTRPGYATQISDRTVDPEWDAFVAGAPGNHHILQTSIWAQVKAFIGWQSLRVTVTDHGKIVAGAQMFVRRIPWAGAIAYIPKGPVLATADAKVVEVLLAEVHRAAAAHRVRYLILQPANEDVALAARLPQLGFQPSVTAVAPVATVMVDLSPDLDEILAAMKKKTRYGVRRGLKDGLTARQGDENDLATFHALLTATSRRQGFTSFGLDYFETMWRILSPQGHIKLFLVEYDDETVSAQIVVAFGDTVTAKLVGWSGEHGQRRPNELLDWTTLTWAKANGYRYYDFEGIDLQAAQAVVRGERPPESVAQTPTSYKLGFGGNVEIYPDAYAYIYNPLLRMGVKALPASVRNGQLLKIIQDRIRTRRSKGD